MKKELRPATEAAFEQDVFRRSHKDGVHMPLNVVANGIAGEWGELVEASLIVSYGSSSVRREKILEEAGDLLWYVQCLHFSVLAQRPAYAEISPGYDPYARFYPRVDVGTVAAGRVCDALKKNAWHGRELDDVAIAINLRELVWQTAAFLSCECRDLWDAMAANIEKLNARYPNPGTMHTYLSAPQPEEAIFAYGFDANGFYTKETP